MSYTGKKRLYVEARMSGKNIQDSAIAAGYSPGTARQSGSRLEKDRDVRAAVVRHKAKLEELNNSPPPMNDGRPQPDLGVDWRALIDSSMSTEYHQQYDNPLDFMRAIMNDRAQDPRLRFDAARALALASFTIDKPCDKGKKEGRANAAKVAAKKFGAMPEPILFNKNLSFDGF